MSKGPLWIKNKYKIAKDIILSPFNEGNMDYDVYVRLYIFYTNSCKWTFIIYVFVKIFPATGSLWRAWHTR